MRHSCSSQQQPTQHPPLQQCPQHNTGPSSAGFDGRISISKPLVKKHQCSRHATNALHLNVFCQWPDTAWQSASWPEAVKALPLTRTHPPRGIALSGNHSRQGTAMFTKRAYLTQRNSKNSTKRAYLTQCNSKFSVRLIQGHGSFCARTGPDCNAKSMLINQPAQSLILECDDISMLCWGSNTLRAWQLAQ